MCSVHKGLSMLLLKGNLCFNMARNASQYEGAPLSKRKKGGGRGGGGKHKALADEGIDQYWQLCPSKTPADRSHLR